MLRTFAYTTFDGPEVVSVIVGSDSSDSSRASIGSSRANGGGVGALGRRRSGGQRASSREGLARDVSPGHSRPPAIRRMGTMRLRALSTCRIVGVTLRRESMWSFWHEYHIHVTTMFGSHTVRRRYREFAALRDELEVAYARRHACAGFFPHKVLLGSSAPAVVAHRRMALEAYLAALLRDRVLRRSRQVVAFLRLDSLWASAATECLAKAAAARKGVEASHAQVVAAAQLVTAAPDARIAQDDAVLRALRRVRAADSAQGSPRADGEAGLGVRGRATTAPRVIPGPRRGMQAGEGASPGTRRGRAMTCGERGSGSGRVRRGSDESGAQAQRATSDVQHLAAMIAHSLQAAPHDPRGLNRSRVSDGGSSGSSRTTSVGSARVGARFDGEVRGGDGGSTGVVPLQRAATFMGWSSALGRGWQPRARSGSAQGTHDASGSGAYLGAHHTHGQLGGRRTIESLGYDNFVPNAGAQLHVSGFSSGASSMDSDRFASGLQSPQGVGVGSAFSATPPSSLHSGLAALPRARGHAAQSPRSPSPPMPSHQRAADGWRALENVVVATATSAAPTQAEAVVHELSGADAGAVPAVATHARNNSARLTPNGAARRGSVGYGTVALAASPPPRATARAPRRRSPRHSRDRDVRVARPSRNGAYARTGAYDELDDAAHVPGRPELLAAFHTGRTPVLLASSA